MLMFVTSNFQCHLVPVTNRNCDKQNDAWDRFETKAKLKISLCVTYELHNLRKALQHPKIIRMVNQHNMIFIHILGNDMRKLLQKSEETKIIKDTLQTYINKLVKLTHILSIKGKIVILSLLLPRKDDTKMETTRLWINDQIIKTVQMQNIQNCHVVCYDGTISVDDKLKHFKKDGYHLTKIGFNALSDFIAYKVNTIVTAPSSRICEPFDCTLKFCKLCKPPSGLKFDPVTYSKFINSTHKENANGNIGVYLDDILLARN